MIISALCQNPSLAVKIMRSSGRSDPVMNRYPFSNRLYKIAAKILYRKRGREKKAALKNEITSGMEQRLENLQKVRKEDFLAALL